MYVILFYGFAAAWLVYGASLALTQIRIQKHGVTLSARVTGNETSDGDIFRPILGYTYNGQFYNVTYGVGDKKKYATGEMLSVQILPQKPEKPHLVGTSNNRTIGFSLGVGLISLAGCLYMTFS